jgi:hypothetical protein
MLSVGTFPSTLDQTRKALATAILAFVCKSTPLVSRFLPALRTSKLSAIDRPVPLGNPQLYAAMLNVHYSLGGIALRVDRL